jgi:hypothetical protein
MSMATTFRIRTGAMAVGRSGKKAPKHLNGAIRITSAAPQAVEAFVAVYGGAIEPWAPDDGRKEWQAILDTNVLPIVVLPGSTLAQWWEAWDSGGCVRRCDGINQVVDFGARAKACQCPNDPNARMADQRACKPTTQILVVCPEVNVAGAGRLVSRGLIAARQLPAALAVAEGMLDRGYRVPAYLRIVHHAGRRDYVVPQLDLIGVGLLELDGGTPSRDAVSDGAKALSAGRPELAGTAPAALAPVASPYDDYQFSPASPRERGEGAPAPMAPLQLASPGASTADQLAQGAPLADSPGLESERGARTSSPGDPPPFSDEDEQLIPMDRQRDFARAVSEWTKAKYPGPGITKTTEAVRGAIVRTATRGRTHSSKAILLTEMSSLMGTFAALKDGRLVTDVGDDGVIVLVPAPTTEGKTT